MRAGFLFPHHLGVQGQGRGEVLRLSIQIKDRVMLHPFDSGGALCGWPGVPHEPKKTFNIQHSISNVQGPLGLRY
jgi:hypothetical protein